MGWKDSPVEGTAAPKWQSSTPVPKEDAGFWTSLGRGAAQGATMDFGDEIGGFIQAAGEKLLPESMGGGGERAAKKGFWDLYSENRNGSRAENRQSRETQGGAFLGGNLAGGLATGALLPGGQARTFTQLVKAGAAGGLASGIGASDADATKGEWGGLALDGILGMLGGAGGATVGYAAGKALPAGLRLTQRVLGNRAVDKGRKVLTNGSGTLSNRMALSEDAVQEALRSGAILPMGTTEGALGRLESRVDALETARQSILSELEAGGVTGPNAQELADRILAAGRNLAPDTMDDAALRVYRDTARKTLEKAPRNPTALASSSEATRAVLPEVTEVGELGLRQTERLKGSLQDKARYRRLLDDEGVNNARKDVARIYRSANEEMVARAGEQAGPGTVVGEMAESFVPVKQRQGRLIEAMNAAEQGATAAAKRKSPNMLEAATAASSVPGAALAIGKNLLKGRWDSTDAAGAYWSSELARALGRAAERAPGRVAAGAGAASAAERTYLQELLGGDDNQALIAALRKPR